MNFNWISIKLDLFCAYFCLYSSLHYSFKLSYHDHFILVKRDRVLLLISIHVSLFLINKAYRITRYLPHSWTSLNNYNHSPNGRIWLCWTQNVWQCTLLDSFAQQNKASNAGGLQVYLTTVYGSTGSKKGKNYGYNLFK